MGFPTKNDHFGVFRGYHHFRKEPPIEVFHSFEKVFQSNPKRIGFNVKNKHEPQDPWVFFCFHLVDFCDTNVGKSLASMNPKGDGCFFFITMSSSSGDDVGHFLRDSVLHTFSSPSYAYNV